MSTPTDPEIRQEPGAPEEIASETPAAAPTGGPDASPDAAALPSAARGPGLFWSVIAILIAADQIVKAIVRTVVPLYESRPLIAGLVDLVHVRNEGVAFGLLNNLDLRYKWVLTTALALTALAGIGYYARHIRQEERLARLGLSMILGGAIGNLIDRVYAGYVLDFVDVYWGGWHFWAFNVADASITIGAILVFIDLLLVKPHASHPV